MGEYKAGKDDAIDPSLRLMAHGLGLGRRPAPAGGKQQEFVQRQMMPWSAVEGGSPAGAAGTRRQGRPWREAHWPEQHEQLQTLVSPMHRLSPASSAAAPTVERGSCAVAGDEFSGRRLLSYSNPVPMGSPRLDCSSFFAGGVLVCCNNFHALDEHCRLRFVSSRCLLRPLLHRSAIAIESDRSISFNDLLGCCICNSVLLFKEDVK
ncbi:uncharacterized protein LOC119324118 isoform X3 [Triticum dicoccoides]|uniref:uncharacterized protein LOC119324118 isoform X3 n=1 Tax=Triticum dicoccoides TaxID=85692 RepID=UPI00189185A3|nr:uncharacterized protein LOC119324118 isoform X3 [Triticum dicoccoides]XP_037453768.1 uncharacterized protein LOC119324118 isoform X3 [Triticum dicoccoides]XP_037453769.1 uncharacterized protein LOC119324118 isoform X3 [Triticum dicoccoides]XP_044412726.1 uncharacterized protein LOC123137176 isoform X2 [Triticum aestivum]XP_044412727.1 uncharacterized protein LOC123137176 isoform X2 [Triticum aestivum]XP_044412728.1 uncharacterized protein LOC123137176 isoform X2 [Triticum aestivum]